jgi:HEPN domain-containing protein
MKRLTQEWIEKAEGDYRVASSQWQGADPVWDAVCYHAGQCAEKYLKAWLVEQGSDFPRTHDLEVLARLCVPTLGDMTEFMDVLAFLTSAAVEVRYPGMIAQRHDAWTCLEIAGRVRHFLRGKLCLDSD